MSVTREIDAPVSRTTRPWQREVVIAAWLLGFAFILSAIPFFAVMRYLERFALTHAPGEDVPEG